MKQQVARILAPLTLLEWGGVLTYFYLSHRVALFLHPHFRPLVLLTGILLLISAICLLVCGTDASAAHDCDAEGCAATHRQLTWAGAFAFLVLFVPLALAVKVSPDSYGIGLIQNRGVADALEHAPTDGSRAKLAALAARQLKKSSPAATPPRVAAPATYAGVDQPVVQATPGSQTYPSADAIPKGWSPSTPDYGPSVNVPDQELDYLTNDEVLAKLHTPATGPHAKKKAALVAVNEQPNAQTKFGSFKDLLDMADSPLRQTSANELPKADDGKTISLEVVDLLVAAQDPAISSSLEGQQVELVGQVLPGENHSLLLLRMLVLCCAADAQPLAVRVDTRADAGPGLQQLTWAKVRGEVHFTKHGGTQVPVIAASEVTPVKRPAEPYLY